MASTTLESIDGGISSPYRLSKHSLRYPLAVRSKPLSAFTWLLRRSLATPSRRQFSPQQPLHVVHLVEQQAEPV